MNTPSDPNHEGWNASYQRLLGEILPTFLPAQRWFAGKGAPIEKVEFEQYVSWPEHSEWLLARIGVWFTGRSEAQHYALPLALAWPEDGEEKWRSLRRSALTKVQIQARTGWLYDAFAEERFCQLLVKLMAQNAQIPLGAGWLRFSATPAFAGCPSAISEALPVKQLAADSSNTSIAIGDRLLMKAYRRLQSGMSPELEMGRFLTEAGFRNIAPLAGALEYEDGNGERTALVLLHGFVANQGDAWRYTQDYLKRFLDNCLQQPEMVRKADEIHGLYRIFATTLGRRTGELHRTLAQISGDPAFNPEPITAADLTRWLNRIRDEAIATFERLAQQRESLPESAWPRVDRLLAARGALLASLKQTATLNPGTVKIRYHGDYHLGQVLVAKEDVIIIDLEGEPSRTLEERRDKQSPLRDVVGMVRSFNYAAHAALRPFTADRQALAPRLDDWERQTRAAFLNGYAEATRDNVDLGIDLAQANPLLQAFTLEKVCYELRYELDNRPDWVEIPLSGLCELLPLLDQPFPRINLLSSPSMESAMSILFEPVQFGELRLQNRVVLAPLTRCRADYQRVPNALMAAYYAQRARMGLLITEATSVEPMGVGYPRTPGIWSEAQVAGWRKITDAVHERGGIIVLQLWHVGRLSDPLYLNGATPVGPSAIAPHELPIALLRPKKTYGVPHALTVPEIAQVVAAFRQGAQNAKRAGFDGVEIHGGNGYLLDQFLQSNANQRTDAYGGSPENRARFPLEVVDAVIEVWGAGRVGYHLAPRCDFLGMGDANPLETFSYLVSALSQRYLAFIVARERAATDSISPKLRPLFTGGFIANEGHTQQTAEQAIASGLADAVAFGMLSIPNPDLVEKFKTGITPNAPQPETFYNKHPYLFDLAEPMPAEGFYEGDREGYLSFGPLKVSA